METFRTRAAAVVVTCTLLVATVGGSSEPNRASRGMVVASDSVAAEVGRDVLQAGGSAVDAAVATAFALAVTLPAAGNIGGGGFLVYRAADGSDAAYDFRETAPSAASPEMFLSGGAYDWARHHDSHLAVGVPGLRRRSPSGLERPRPAAVAAPGGARRSALARDGFILTHARAASLAGVLPRMGRYPAAVAAFSNEGAAVRRRRPVAPTGSRGRPWSCIAAEGPDGFYRGRTAALVAREMAAHGGLITEADLAAYAPRVRQPIRGTYRGYEDRIDAAAQLRRDHAGPDAQRAGGLRPAGRRLRFRPQRPPHRRGHAPRLRGPGLAPRGSRLQPRHAGASADVEGARGWAARDHRPRSRLPGPVPTRSSGPRRATRRRTCRW